MHTIFILYELPGFRVDWHYLFEILTSLGDEG